MVLDTLPLTGHQKQYATNTEKLHAVLNGAGAVGKMNTANVPVAKILGTSELTNVVAQVTQHQVARKKQFAISTVILMAHAALTMVGAAGKTSTANVMVAQIIETGGLTINARTATWHLTDKLQNVTHMDLRLVVLIITGAAGKTNTANVTAALTTESNKRRTQLTPGIGHRFTFLLSVSRLQACSEKCNACDSSWEVFL